MSRALLTPGSCRRSRSSRRDGGLRHMLTVLDGHSRAEWPVALIDLLTGWAIRVTVTFFAAHCAYVFRTFKVRRRLVRPITTCRTRSRWASLFIMTNFFAECTDCAQYLGAVVLIVPLWIQSAFASRALVLRACEAARVSMVRAAACFASWITFTRGMAGFTACVAHSVRTRASFLAMPRLRA